MKNSKKLFLAATFLIVFISFLGINTPTAKAITVAELQAQINALMAQITQLQQQLAEMQGQEPSWCHNFNVNLKIGDRGCPDPEAGGGWAGCNYEGKSEEIEALHKALKKEGFNVFGDEDQNNYFGNSTASAVVGFQEKYASEVLAPWRLQHGTGFVGGTTRAKLNQLYGCGITCINECSSGQTRCSDTTHKSTCGNYDSDVCLEWSSLQACPLDQVCQNGECVEKSISITVTSPNGGEEWEIGKTYRMKWNSEGVDSVVISLTDHGHIGTGSGGSMSVAHMPISASIGYYDWTVPSEGGLPRNDDGTRTSIDKYKINIVETWTTTDSSGTTYFTYGVRDSSDNYFSIVEPTTTACTDSDGGKDYYEKGTASGIKLGADYLETYEDVCLEDNPDGDNLREAFCTNNQVTFEFYNCPNGCENGACKPVQMYVVISSPNGGETIVEGQPTTINWGTVAAYKETRLYLYVLELNTLGEWTPKEIGGNIGSVLGKDGSFTWTPAVGLYASATKKYKMRISNHPDEVCASGLCVKPDPYISDDSNDYFSIVEPTTTCTDTDGGINYYVKGTTYGLSPYGPYVSPTGDYVINTDQCGGLLASEGQLIEYYCDGKYNKSTIFTCPSGCEDGACKPGGFGLENIENQLANISKIISDLMEAMK